MICPQCMLNIFCMINQVQKIIVESMWILVQPNSKDAIRFFNKSTNSISKVEVDFQIYNAEIVFSSKSIDAQN